ncbi:tetratricopeptide repeat protein [Labilibaculum sp. DW002]|uniref:Tetratricopeptide repeat protein n=1 Tax=Paralabilibaculum antarcticum TaxID=2912572 RepID=A0ABT5VVW2_9BACT|nr:tetratricopeptide repeat protein [Labilibaculum sp. DW002]MDE5419560.1 tetratricopeptide repeat protein [Labilibaculum sp. DW002]
MNVSKIVGRCSILLGLLFAFTPLFSAQKDSTDWYIDLYNSVAKQDSSYTNELNACYRYFQQQKDTLWLTKTLIERAEDESNEGNYGAAISDLWEALDLAELRGNIIMQHQVHANLGWIYNVFGKSKEAFMHEQKALDLSKDGLQSGLLTEGALISAYFDFVHSYRRKENYTMALQYLDSCYYIADKYKYTSSQKAYLTSEKGNIFRKQGRLSEALEILIKVEKEFQNIDQGYLTIIYFYLGNTYYALKDYKNAELAFEKAIENVDVRPRHYDVKAECLNRMAKSLEQQGKYQEAYQVLSQAKELNDELFSTKGFQNSGVLDIRNTYKEKLDERDRIILERDKELIEQKASNLRIRMFLMGSFALFVIALLVFRIQFQRKKHKIEKERQKNKAQLQEEKSKVLVEMKNKELTSFTLRLIDKDTMISDLAESITEYAPANEALLKSVKLKTTGRLKLWEEFDKRFIDVNKGFYETLKSRFPELTPTELKHCALIKLNFSSKEMAQLLNISLNGVNTSRYRIRKKLKLEREDNLVSFIDGV